MIEQTDALKKIKSLKDNSQDIIFADPPYALGSTVKINKEGKPYYQNAKDFMGIWDMPDEKFWEEFFIESKRVLKYGGRVLFFGIDRQLMLFQYYGIASGLEIKQSLYWYFLSSFPKSADLSKNINKRLGASDLGIKYEGYKYSISPLKQTLETIMVFQKPQKSKSVLDDVLLYEQGDKEISPSIWDIDSGRVKTDEQLGREQKDGPLSPKMGFNDNKMGDKFQEGNKNGRYPSQLFVDEDVAKTLDTQSGNLTSGGVNKLDHPKQNPNGIYGKFNKQNINNFEASEGGASKILHKIPYQEEELNLVMYCPKVSSKEREAGCSGFEEKMSSNLPMRSKDKESTNKANDNSNTHRDTVTKNNHPTLKPLKLIHSVATLLKTPNPQNVFFPFAGSGSEIIGFMKAGFDENLLVGSELSEEYTKIAKARIDYWRGVDFDEYLKTKELKEETETLEEW